MSRISGWCNGFDGCNSLGAHEICGDRVRRGLLRECACTAWDGGHTPADVGDTANHGTSTEGAPTDGP